MMNGSETLLHELATMDEVSAWVPTNADHVAGSVPSWCELVVEFKRTGEWPINTKWPLRRHDGEMVIDVLHQTLHPRSGGSVVGMLEHELDAVVDRIQRRIGKGKSPKPEDIGAARGLTLSIAILVNPYAYDLDAVRDAAMDRYEARLIP